MLQNIDGSFMVFVLFIKNYEDFGLLFFDVDGDQDLDFYVVFGGFECYVYYIYYQGCFYFNDGFGYFILSIGCLFEMLSSIVVVVGSDFDVDGDIDLFVGGWVVLG